MSQSDTTTTEKLDNVSKMPPRDYEQQSVVQITASADVSGLTPPRKLYLKQLARETERRFIRMFGSDADEVTDVSDTVTTFPPAELERVAVQHSIDTSEMCAARTESIERAADKLAEFFRIEADAYREKHTE